MINVSCFQTLNFFFIDSDMYRSILSRIPCSFNSAWKEDNCEDKEKVVFCNRASHILQLITQARRTKNPFFVIVLYMAFNKCIRVMLCYLRAQTKVMKTTVFTGLLVFIRTTTPRFNKARQAHGPRVMWLRMTSQYDFCVTVYTIRGFTQSVLIFSIRNHPRSFMVDYYLCGVFYLSKLLFRFS